MTQNFIITTDREKFKFELKNGEVWLIEENNGIPIKTSNGQDHTNLVNNIDDAKQLAIHMLYSSKRINKEEYHKLQ